MTPAASSTAGVPVTATVPASSWPWKVAVFLLFATALSYLDRQALSVVAPQISRELQLDNAQLGFLLSAFFYTYSLLHIFVGIILDRFHIRYTYAIFVALWSISQILTSFSRTYGELFASRMALGTFEAAGQTGAARIIARILPRKDRAFANGIMMSGGSLGAAISAPLVIWLNSTVGWRIGFSILGALGIVWAVSWILWFRPSEEMMRSWKAAADVSRSRPISEIFRNPRFWACAAGAAFTIPIIHISSSWIPTYLVQQWKLPLGAALSGYLLVVYLGLDLGFIGGGALVSLMSRAGKLTIAEARKRVMILSVALMIAAALVPQAGSVWQAVALVCIMNAGRAAWGAIFLSFNQDIAPGRVAFVAGSMGCIGALSGALLVWWIGIISKSSGFNIPFLLIAFLAVAGTIAVLLPNWETTTQDA